MNNLDPAGRSALHYAAERTEAATVQQLLAAGADPRLADANGWTPLHFAAQAQAPDVMRLLLAAGADADAPDAHGNTPLWRAVFSSRGQGECIRLLRAHGADPRRPNAHGVSPLSLVQTIANYPVAQCFADLLPTHDPAA